MIKNNTPFNILVSFAFANRQMMQVCRKYVEEKKINLMIDSGAFTAFNHNKKGITLDAYCNFLKEYGDICEKYVMLDVIANKEASIVNYEKMLAKGLAPMYTATIYDNDFDYIGKTLDICPDICVAGGATSNGEWIRKRYCEVYEKTGKRARIHALGIALFMEGEHLCKTMRGAKKKGKMSCAYLTGVFRENPAARAEFLAATKE